MELKDYYCILGVPRTATARDILRAYRDLAKRYHPDRLGPQSTATFQDIVEAYEVLSDPERRRHYNQSLSEVVDVPPAASPVGSARPQPEPLIPKPYSMRLHRQPDPLVPEPMALLSDFGPIRPSFDALYARLLQNFIGRGTPKAARLESLHVEVQLSPYEALQGVIVPVSIPGFVHCTDCRGSGRDWHAQCLSCQGQGMVETEDTVHVPIPPRVREGTLVEVPLPGLGMHHVFLCLHIRVTW